MWTEREREWVMENCSFGSKVDQSINQPTKYMPVFSYYAVILLSVISYRFSGMHKKLSVLLNEAKIAALGRALSGTLL